MAVRLAKKVCPDLVIVPPNPRLYARASRALHELLARWAPVIEPRWYGHAFLDLTGTERLFGPAVEWRRESGARRRNGSGAALGGVATNKVVSEAATRSGRSDGQRSDGQTVGRSDGQMGGCGSRRGAKLSSGCPPVIVLPTSRPIRRRLDDYQLDLIGEIARDPRARHGRGLR